VGFMKKEYCQQNIKDNMAIKLAQEVVYKKVILTPDEIFLFV